MSSFDAAWDSIEKEWSPNWRKQAEYLKPIYARQITNHPQMGYEKLGLSYDEDTNRIEDGMTMTTYEHPFDSRFMVKDPRGLPYHWKIKRHQNEYDGKMMDQVLEELGYPIASEYDAGDYAIQPKLTELKDYNANREEQKIANDWVMRHVVGDRGSGFAGTRNWGQDQLGNWRLFDAEMRLSNPNDHTFHPTHYQTQNIDLPANRLLNFMDEHEIGHGIMGVDPPETVAFKELRSWLERFEPYSNNPKYVEVDGKAKWMEGY